MSSPNPLTIQLAEGTTNSLTMTGDRVYGIYVFGSALTITGNGTLNVQSEDMAINDAWGVAITGGTVNAASSTYYGIGRVTIGADISSVTITGTLGAIYGGSNEDQELINAIAVRLDRHGRNDGQGEYCNQHHRAECEQLQEGLFHASHPR
jgi:hypothetical protein